MRKAERLFQLLTYLRGRRQAATAAQIAQTLQVSERTVYRDVQALMLSGVPIESETGTGYRLKKGYHLPPLMFEEDELQALLLGMKMVQSWSDTKMAKAASLVLQKVEAIVPDTLKAALNDDTLIVPDFHITPSIAGFSETIRMAIKTRQTLNIGYVKLEGGRSERKIEPLGLVYWGKVWTMLAWCQLRKDYRSFRVESMLG